MAVIISLITAGIAAGGVWVATGQLAAANAQTNAMAGQLGVMRNQLSDSRKASNEAEVAAGEARRQQSRLIDTNRELADAAAAQARAAQASADTMARQLAVAQTTFEASHRPKIEILGAASATDFTITNGQIRYQVSVSYRNAGTAIAQNLVGRGSLSTFTDYLVAQREACKAGDSIVRKTAKAVSQAAGTAVYEELSPETPPATMTFGLVSPLRALVEDLSKPHDEWAVDYIWPVFVGCFSYTFPGSEALHHKRFSFHITERIEGSHGPPLPRRRDHVAPKDRVTLSPVGTDEED